MHKLFSPIVILLFVFAIGGSANAQVTLADGFQACPQLTGNPLATDLLWSVTSPDRKAEFVTKYAAAFTGYAQTTVEPEDGAPQTTARIQLTGTEQVAGLHPRWLTATTCSADYVGGRAPCGLQVFTLEFGRLTSEQTKQLKRWAFVAQSGSTRGNPVELVVSAGKRVALTCVM